MSMIGPDRVGVASPGGGEVNGGGVRGRLRSQCRVQMVERMVELRGLLVALAGLNILLLVLAALCVVACHLQLLLQVGHFLSVRLELDFVGERKMMGVKLC